MLVEKVLIKKVIVEKAGFNIPNGVLKEIIEFAWNKDYCKQESPHKITSRTQKCNYDITLIKLKNLTN